MPDHFTTSVFEFNIRVEPISIRVPGNPPAAAAAGGSGDDLEKRRFDERHLVSRLNGASSEISQEIEEEIRRATPRYILARAEVNFHQGSLLAIGIIVLSFVGSSFTAAASKTLEEQFSGILRFALQRVISRRLVINGYQPEGPMDIDVATASTPSNDTTAAGQTIATPLPTRQPYEVRYLTLIMLINALLLLALLVFVVLASTHSLGIHP